ncbi:MAG: heavy metal translocating P-type ATPase [Paracoccaceae bacterium]
MPLDGPPEVIKINLLIPGMTCAGCMTKVERCLVETTGVLRARANLTRHMVTARFDPRLSDTDMLVAALTAEGFAARPVDAALIGQSQDRTGRDLLLRLGVAGFAAMNVMLLSISVWSGADDAMRDLLHWVSALIALPAIAYAGMPFYRSAGRALSARRLNMDVPISLAVLLAAGNSVAETLQGGAHAYFDAGIMLLFFLLIGRYLEHRTRAQARSAAAELMAMTGRTALRILSDGSREMIAVDKIRPGMKLEIAAGERIPADGKITEGMTEIDRALVTGESRPEPVKRGDPVHAGMLNLTGAVQVAISASGDDTLLAEIARMVDAAERGRGRYDRIADRAARIYAPLVHILALAAFVGWMLVAADARLALQIAVAVLIVTCPCALALAVPTVHTATSARLFRQGIFLKDGAELERLAEADMVGFDKTGTLTDGMPRISQGPTVGDAAWSVAAALAQQSRHPYSQAIAQEAHRMGIAPANIKDVCETPGIGVEGMMDGQSVQLGRPANGSSDETGVLLTLPDRSVSFTFAETLRPGAVETCAALRAKGLDLAILSGDAHVSVHRIAGQLAVETKVAQMMPGEKLEWLKARRAEGRKVLMVGDGLNDAPALAAAHASVSPASAVDVAKTAAGLVFTGASLNAVNAAHSAALVSRQRTFQSFGIAVAYNIIAVPLAMAGFVTPLFAALAMSGSSILVILNALRKGRAA